MTTIPDAPVAVPASLRRRWRLPLIAAQALAFVFLALTSGVAYVVVLTDATGAAERRLVDRAARIVDAQVALLRSRLDPVTEHLELIADLIAHGRLSIESPVEIREALVVAMTRVPAVSTAAFASFDLRLHRAQRQADGLMAGDTVSLLQQPRGLERFRELQAAHHTFWGTLFWSEALGQPVLNVRTPVRRTDDAFIGGLIATVAVGDLSKLFRDPNQGGGSRYFILVGRDKVLAHRRLIDPAGLGLSESKPLPTIGEVEDPVLARIWDPPVHTPQIDRALGNVGHVEEAEGRRWVFIHREVHGYGPDPWLVGQYFPIEDATGDLDRLAHSGIVGAATLAVAVLLALVMGITMARSIRTITSAAESIQRLEFDQPFHRRSRLREIDDAGLSLDRARGALQWFGAYVPRRLVSRLMELGADAVRSQRHYVTVMFSDIVEFTAQAENLPEQETADLLNHHFALLAACIEREQGVIDKYIGDSVMAVWGGLSIVDDHADRAVRAALAIAQAINNDNASRRACGRAAIRVRIGLHSGPVVVGNIGAPGRVNFTVVGDTVNVAQRIEQLGKDFMCDDDEVIVLISGNTLTTVRNRDILGLGPHVPVRRQVKGHGAPVEVYRLV